MICAIWCRLYNLKNVKNIYGGDLLLVELQPEACKFNKITLLLGVFHVF